MKKAVNLILFGLICFLSTSCVDKDLFPYPKEPQKFTRITSIDWTNFFPEEKEGGKEQYIYDEAGNLLEILNINEDNSINQNFIPKRTNGQVTSMDYFDSKGEKISEIFYKYDKSGRIIETKWTPLILSHPNREEYIWNGDKIIEIKLFYKYYLELNKDTVVIFNYIHDEKGNVIRSEEHYEKRDLIYIYEYEHDDKENIGQFRPIEEIPFIIRMSDMFWATNNVIKTTRTKKVKSTGEVLETKSYNSYTDIQYDEENRIMFYEYESLPQKYRHTFTYKTFIVE